MSQCVSRNFPGIFGVFRIFSVALLIYLDISGLFFAQENILKKTNLILLDWAEPEGPTPSGPPRPSRRPGRSPSRPGSHGQARPGRRLSASVPGTLGLAVAPYKGRSSRPRARPSCSAASTRPCCAAPPAARRNRAGPWPTAVGRIPLATVYLQSR
jgi:hypothetical protein